MTTLSGKTALVTGSTSGIGLGIALSLAKAGANLILNGFGDASRVIAEVEQFGGKVGHHPADVSVPAQIADMIAYAEREFGGVDILVNNAGIQHVAPVDEFPVERWDSIIAINLSSVFHSTRLSLPGMRSQGLGPGDQHRLGAWPGRFGGQGCLCRRQARGDRLDQSGRPGNCHS
jgi:3-hydroxybutyrate dehydrogenase